MSEISKYEKMLCSYYRFLSLSSYYPLKCIQVKLSSRFISSIVMQHKLEPNIVLGSVDRVVTAPAAPKREQLKT